MGWSGGGKESWKRDYGSGREYKPAIDPEDIGSDTSQYDRARVRGIRLLNHIMDELESVNENGKFKNNVVITPNDDKETVKL